MGEPKRKSGRPKRQIGLTPPVSLKKVVDGDDMRDLRAAQREQERSVLPEAPANDVEEAGTGGVFAAGAEATAPADDELPADIDITALLRKIVAEPANIHFQDTPGRKMTNLEVILRGTVNDAMTKMLGNHKAREFVIDRLVGKAGRAAPPQGTNSELDNELDRASVALLNGITEKKD